MPAQSGVRFLAEETTIARRLGVPIPHPIRLFALSDLGLDEARFLGELAPSFADLDWDFYDVRRTQVERLLAARPDETERLTRFIAEYYAGRADLSEVSDLLDSLPQESAYEIRSLLPQRRRAIAHFRLERAAGSWRIVREAVASFSQTPMDASDWRSLPRVFAPMRREVAEHPIFAEWLRAMAHLVSESAPDARELRLTCHQMSSVARPGRTSSNSPEGIHQDGADYIVSALIVERAGVTGGVSRIFGPDKQTQYLSHALQPGQGLFQADTGSPLWHDVTPVVFDPTTGREEGVRSLFGLDIRITG